MFKISKLTDYSTVVLSYIAKAPHQYLTARDITEATHIALPTVSKILKILARAKLLQSHRGVHGGYCLALSATQITVADIVQAMDGTVALTECSHTHSHCSIQQSCHLRGNWQMISDIIVNTLQQITLADLTNTSLPINRYINFAKFEKEVAHK